MAVLRAENLAKSYGGLRVFSDLSFALEAGEKVALIGPNGAGKTTLMNVLTGMTPASAGRVSLFDADISDMPSHRRAAFGLARSFQLNSLFNRLSLLHNVMLAIQGVQGVRYRMFRAMMAAGPNVARARALLESVGLWGERDTTVAALSHGQQRQVEIIMALASDPKMLLLDEPSAGLTKGESDALIAMIRNLTKGTTVLFSAHDMDLVFTLADRVIVLYNGQIVAEGPPRDIQTDARVREIYLGSDVELSDA